MSDQNLLSGSPLTRQNYTPASKAACVRRVAAEARQTDVACAQGLPPALLGRWQRQAVERPSNAHPQAADVAVQKRLLAECTRFTGTSFPTNG